MVMSQYFDHSDLKRSMEKIAAINREYSEMPLEERLEELRRLRNRKEGLKRVLNATTIRIDTLEYMPDIAVERVKTDEIAISLLQDLRKRGDVSYRDLTKPFGSNPYLPIVYNRLHLLSTAELIEMQVDPTCHWDNIIKLTERGRNLQYVEPTE